MSELPAGATMQNADPRPFVLPAEDGGARWLEACWGKRHGCAQRLAYQQFAWTTLYYFVPDDGEAVVLAGDLLGMGRLRPQRKERELAKRKGPCFRAICEGKRGVAWLVPASQPSLATWDFLSDDGVFRRVPDTRIELFQNWGEPTAWNVWEHRVREDARKLKRQKALRHPSLPSARRTVLGEKGRGMTGLFRPSFGTTAHSVIVVPPLKPADRRPRAGSVPPTDANAHRVRVGARNGKHWHAPSTPS